jgi:hypothetical protein
MVASECSSGLTYELVLEAVKGQNGEEMREMEKKFE